LPLVKHLTHNDSDPHVQEVAVRVLADRWPDDPETLSLVKDRARSDSNEGVRTAASYELLLRWKQEPETLPLLKALARSASSNAWAKLLTEGWPDDPEVQAILAERKNDADTAGGQTKQ
jgi:hypothetical protein